MVGAGLGRKHTPHPSNGPLEDEPGHWDNHRADGEEMMELGKKPGLMQKKGKICGILVPVNTKRAGRDQERGARKSNHIKDSKKEEGEGASTRTEGSLE